MSRRSAFTLVELLVVVAILALLMGMAATMLSSARGSSMKGSTLAIIGKVDAALRLFGNEVGSYPWQVGYADVAAGDAPTNQLGWHLGTSMTKPQRLDLFADQDSAADQFRYVCVNPADPNGWYKEQTAKLKEPAYRISRLLPIDANLRNEWNSESWNTAFSRLLNRFAEERARLAIACGHTDLRGPAIVGGYDASATRVLPSPKSRGWAADYLGGQLEARYLRDDAVLDAWRRPLAYIANILPGARGTTATQAGVNINGFDTTRYGLGGLGRTILWPPGTGSRETPVDAAGYPDAGNLLRSDARRYARPGMELEFELISAGADGRMDWMRDAPANRDNILGGDYLRGLK